MAKKKQGGKRKGAGRKPDPDKKEPIAVYVRKSKIESEGGKEKVRKFLYKCLDK